MVSNRPVAIYAHLFEILIAIFAVYCSLIGSCSALMKSDVELIKGNRNFAEEPVSAPDYNPVWRDLCNITRVRFPDRELGL